MGCASSKPKAALAAPAQDKLVVQPVLWSDGDGDGKGKGKGKGKGVGKDKGMGKGKDTGTGNGTGKGKGKGRGQVDLRQPFQVQLGGEWKVYDREEDLVLKQAFLVGQPCARYRLRGQKYEYDFKRMRQVNRDSGKERSIRAPRGFRQPSDPLLPKGAMTVVTVPPNSAGTAISIKDPNNPGRMLQVAVPAHARAGQKMVVPIPERGESLADVKRKQEAHSRTATGAKVAKGLAAGAAVAGLAVGGVILGDHLSGGAISDATGVDEAVAGAAEDVGHWAVGATDDVADWAEGAGVTDAAEAAWDWTTGAAEDVGEWTAGAAEDVGEWTVGAAEDAGDWAAGAAEGAWDWLGDAAHDVGDFVVDLF